MSPRAQFLTQKHEHIWLVCSVSCQFNFFGCVMLSMMQNVFTLNGGIVSQIMYFHLGKEECRQMTFLNVYQGEVCLKSVVKYLSYELQRASKNEQATVPCAERPVFVLIFTWPTLQGWPPYQFLCAQVLCLQDGSNCSKLIFPNEKYYS